MDGEMFRKSGYRLVDWIAGYLEGAEKYPVAARVRPGEIRAQLPEGPPAQGEPMDRILDDFERLIVPGLTHWNHPRFFAYFPANHSGPSILGELLSAGLGVNAMVWQTSPAATELEEQMMDWLRRLIGLGEGWKGAIQDTASSATLCALLCARERLSDHQINQKGFGGLPNSRPLRVYASTQAHSSVEKAARIGGFGTENLVKIREDLSWAMDPADLEQRIISDKENGFKPCCVVATVGTTSSTAMDPLRPIGEIARRHNLWMHVDAALAGSAAILPEMRWILDGSELAHSLVFNPHKWLFTNFDCSAFFCQEPETLIRTFSINPEYLKTDADQRVTNFRDWGIPLGRRFRALKLWFVLRSFGVEGLQQKIRLHLDLAQRFKYWVEESQEFELLAPVPLQTVCFRFNPAKDMLPSLSTAELERLNLALLQAVNRSGKIFLSHTRLADLLCLRLSIGQTATELRHVEEAWQTLRECALGCN